MSYKNQAEIDQVNTLIDNLAKGEYLNASTIGLTECIMFLSTHNNSGYFITNPLKTRQAELINSTLVERQATKVEADQKVVKTCPSEIYSGMLITQHGYTGKVVKVERYESIDRGIVDTLEPFVYCVYMEYVHGDLSMHKYFTNTINNGCNRGYLSVQQGNRRATFNRVLLES